MICIDDLQWYYTYYKNETVQSPEDLCSLKNHFFNYSHLFLSWSSIALQTSLTRRNHLRLNWCFFLMQGPPQQSSNAHTHTLFENLQREGCTKTLHWAGLVVLNRRNGLHLGVTKQSGPDQSPLRLLCGRWIARARAQWVVWLELKQQGESDYGNTHFTYSMSDFHTLGWWWVNWLRWGMDYFYLD